jgi:hypothetical protein
MNAEAIRDLIRTKLQTGRLPRDGTARAFGRPGNWQKCAACESTMAKPLLMMEIYPQTGERNCLRLHGACYTLWKEERRERLSKAPLLTPLSSAPPALPPERHDSA